MTRIGFIGVGVMGGGMAKNLLKRGYELTVYDVRAESVNRLKQIGAKPARSAKEAGANEVIFSMVRDDAQTQEVMWGENGVLSGVGSGATIIVSSTVSPSMCQRLGKDAGEKEVGVLDAPVSGGPIGADAGTLTLMVGGDRGLFEKMEPILKGVSKNIFYLGNLGMGQVGKLVNNTILFGNMLSTTDGLAFGMKAGIPLQTILDFVKVSSGNSWVAQNWDTMIVPFKKDHSMTSSLSMLYKDLALALKYAKQIGIDLPFSSNLGQMDLFRLPEG